MPADLFKDSFNEYFESFRLALSMGILLVFVLFFLLYSNAFISSGSIFLAFAGKTANPLLFIIQLVGLLAFLLLYSFFVSLIVFAAKSKAEKRLYYLRDRLKKIVSKMLAFNALFVLVSMLIGIALSQLLIPGQLTALVLLIISMLVFFVPQSIVVDEESLFTCFLKNIDFMLGNFNSWLLVLGVSILLVGITPFIELAFDSLYFSGRFVSLILMLVIVIPFIEIMKTKAYIRKYPRPVEDESEAEHDTQQ
ncbi:hypothetical protein HZB89_02190, partial [archaeon]|nr:hypothetical protein [archaeon]